MSRSLTFLITLTMFVLNAQSACLSKEILTSLGCSEPLDTPADNSVDPTICKKEKKVCCSIADLEGIKDQIKGNMKEIRRTFSGGAKFLEKMAAKIVKFCTKAMEKSEGETFAKKGKFKDFTDADLTSVKTICDSCIADDCKSLIGTATTNEDGKECNKSMSQVLGGSYCALMGENGDQIVTTSSTGVIETINVNKTTAEKIMVNCKDQFTTVCENMNISTLFFKYTKGKNPNRGARLEKIQTGCTLVSEFDKCTTDIATCDTTLIANLLKMLTVGKPEPLGEDPEKMETEAAENGDVTESRILAASTVLVEINATASGVDVLAGADESGFDFDDLSGVKLWATSVISVLLMLNA